MKTAITSVRRLARARVVWLACLCGALACLSSGSVGRAQDRAATVVGQTVTVLPDGRELLLGGAIGQRALTTASLRDPQTGVVTALGDLRHARAWQTATLLPDGSILVLGGLGSDGRAVAEAERLDVSHGTTTILPPLNWRPRAASSATLTTGRQIVLAGGLVDGAPVGEVDVLDLDTWQVTPIGQLPTPRAFHSARLLADGRTEVWAGDTPNGPQQISGATIVPATGAIDEIFAPEADQVVRGLAASDPVEGSTDVGLRPQVTLRLTRPARMDTVSGATVTLAGPVGPIAATVRAAEQGRLVFVTPDADLEAGTTYVVTAQGIADAQPFPILTLTFTTAADKKPTPDDDERWDPSASSGWRAHRPESRWQRMAPLEAPPGVTALSGQILRLNGRPLAKVSLTINGRTTRSDDTGRFLLRLDDMPTGWTPVWIDGRSASRKDATYGTFEVGLLITSGRTTVLPYTVWMPLLDTAHAVTVPSPTAGETVVSTPLIPGLELRLPGGTVIRDHDGQIVHTVTITPVPLDRPPFPLPAGVDVPLYFTVQPGGAYIYANGHGGRLIYPNGLAMPPGSRTDFWDYSADHSPGWRVYGKGTVTADGRQIVPNPGVEFYEFSGAMVAGPGFMPWLWPLLRALNPFGHGGDPVDLNTGLFILDKTDLALPDVVPLALTRTYRQADARSRAFGIGTTHNYDIFLVGDVNPYTYVDLVLPDGGRVLYARTSPGTSYADAIYEHVTSQSVWFKSQIRWNGNGWDLIRTDGTTLTFREGSLAQRPQHGALTRIRDRFGNVVTLTRNSDDDLTRIESPNGRWIILTVDSATHRVTQAQDNIGRVVSYTYDGLGRLWKVTDPAAGVTEYTYDTYHRMLTLKDARGIIFLTNEYDTNDRVTKQTQVDGTTYLFVYTADPQGHVTHADVTDPRGIVRRVAFNTDRYTISQIEAVGTGLERTTSLTRLAASNFITRVLDPLGRRTDLTYDGLGNLSSVTALAGTAQAATWTLSYEPQFQQLASVSDPLNHVTKASYTNGMLTTVRDAMGHATTLGFNAAGQLLSVTDPLGATTQLNYSRGDLVSVTNPLGERVTKFVDAAGRTRSVTSPLGHSVNSDFDALNRPIGRTDPLNQLTGFSYDANGNPLTLTDARSHTTTYTYDVMDRLDTRVDPLQRGESLLFDGNGNLRQVTDRKQEVTSATYDSLDRLSLVTYADQSTTSYDYDAGDRLVQIVDSLGGTITRTYDDSDHLLTETTPQGTVTYTCDPVGRRASMTVTGQPAVTYTYDAADRLTSITQGTAAVGFGYDDAGRRTSATLPNGIVIAYAYDPAARVTGILYSLAATTLGTLSYSYDAEGHRTSVGGTWARTGLPMAVSSATYDAANEITQWAGTAFSYDANGNLTSDGTRTYAWDARNQLTNLSGGVSASFGYDGVGRRRTKTVSGSGTSFLYDGMTLVQELSGGGVSANLLPGLTIDEVMWRTDASGTQYFLPDALGSTLALADASAAVQTAYSYEPFGATTTSGSASANSRAFTGRESDGTGLYNFRARYYDPRSQRFISEDPIEFAAGDVNLYGYGFNAPTIFKDPTGLIVVRCRQPQDYFGRKDPSHPSPSFPDPREFVIPCDVDPGSVWFLPEIPELPIVRPGHDGLPRVSLHLDRPGTHTFPWGGRPGHIQIDIYWDGVRGSNMPIRIPWPF